VRRGLITASGEAACAAAAEVCLPHLLSAPRSPAPAVGARHRLPAAPEDCGGRLGSAAPGALHPGPRAARRRQDHLPQGAVGAPARAGRPPRHRQDLVQRWVQAPPGRFFPSLLSPAQLASTQPTVPLPPTPPTPPTHQPTHPHSPPPLPPPPQAAPLTSLCRSGRRPTSPRWTCTTASSPCGRPLSLRPSARAAATSGVRQAGGLPGGDAQGQG
jgi:hypothetical protein